MDEIKQKLSYKEGIKQISSFKSVPQNNDFQIDINIQDLDELIGPSSLEFTRRLEELKGNIDRVEKKLTAENFNKFDEFYFLDFTLKDISSLISELLNGKSKKNYPKLFQLGFMIGKYNGVLGNIESLKHSKALIKKNQDTGKSKQIETQTYIHIAAELFNSLHNTKFTNQWSKIKAIDAFLRKTLEKRFHINEQRASGQIAKKLKIDLPKGAATKNAREEMKEAESYLLKKYIDQDYNLIFKSLIDHSKYSISEKCPIYGHLLFIARKVYMSLKFQRIKKEVPLKKLSKLIINIYKKQSPYFYLNEFNENYYASNIATHLFNENSYFYSIQKESKALPPGLTGYLEELIFETIKSTPKEKQYLKHLVNLY